MQMVATGRRRNIVHFHCLFEEKNVNSALEWGQPYSKFSFGEVYRWIYVQKSLFTALLTCRHKTQFLTVYMG